MADDPRFKTILKAIQGSSGGAAVADGEEDQAPEDKILSAIRGGGAKPAASVLAPVVPFASTQTSNAGAREQQAARLGKPGLPLGPPNNLFVDTSKIPVAPFNDRFVTPSESPDDVRAQNAAEDATAAQKRAAQEVAGPEMARRAKMGLPINPEAIAAEKTAASDFITAVMTGSRKMPLPAFTEPGPNNPYPLGIRASNVGELTDLANEYLNRPDIPKTRTQAFFAGVTGDAIKNLNDMFLSPVGVSASALGIGEVKALSKAGQLGGDALKLAQEYEAMQRAGASAAELGKVQGAMKQSILAAANAQKVATAGRIAGAAAGAGFATQGGTQVAEGVAKKDLPTVLGGLGQMALGGAATVGAVHGGGGVEAQVKAETAARATKAAEGEVTAHRAPQVPAEAPKPSQPSPPAQLPPAAGGPIGAGESLAPETSATLHAQVDALAKGTNKVVYFPKGSQTIPAPPEDANVTIVKGNKPGAGTYYHDDSVTPADIRKAVKNGTYGELLGNVQTKEEAAASGAPPLAVVARDANATEVKASVVESGKPDVAAAQAAKLKEQFPEAKISLETPESVIAGRQASTAQPTENAPQVAVSGETPQVKEQSGPEEEAQEVHVPGITAPRPQAARGPREKTDLTKYEPDVLEAARTELKNAASLASSFERPGRYKAVRVGATPHEDETVGWFGVSSPREMLAQQYPWYNEFRGGAGKLAEVAKKGKGYAHDALLGQIAKRLQDQREIARKVVGPEVEELKTLAAKVRDIDPAMADELTGLAEGRYYSANDLKGYVDSKVSEAQALAEFNQHFDTLAAETPAGEREPGTDESLREVSEGLLEHPEGIREEDHSAQHETILKAIREYQEPYEKERAAKAAEPEKAKIPLRPPGKRTLPGMEQAVEEQKKAAGEYQGEKLTEEVNKPPESIEEAAGTMERESPLFRGTGASPQNEMFGAKTKTPPVENLTPRSTIASEKEPANAEATKPVGGTGERALEGAPSENVRGAREVGNAGRSGAEGGGSDRGRTDLSDRERDELRRGVGSSEGEPFVPADRGGRATARREPGQSIGSGQPGNDYRITESDSIGAGGPKEKFRNNVSAIRLVKQLLAEGRPATPEEQSTLVKYTGWGWTGNSLFNPYNREWAKELKELQGLLSDEEFRAARASTTNAHYTSPEVIKGVWDAVQRLGFTGGRILEPSAGIGHFLGLMPSDLAVNSRKTAIELDNTSGNILKQLYQSVDARIQGFEKFQGPDNFYDVAISNVPFGDYRVHDPAYNKYALSIHNYFIAKMLDKVRPGGLVAAITSHHTMDAVNSKIRQVFADRGDLVGAIRLPDTAFRENAGTEVTTDVLFFRKRAPGEAAAGESFLGSKELSAPAGERPIAVNEYFHKHPSMMLGNMELSGTMYGSKQPTLRAWVGEDLGEAFQKAIAKLPENVMGQHEAPEAATQQATVEEISDYGEVKPHGLVIKNGKVMRRRGDVLIEEADFPKSAYARLKGMLLVRNAARELFQAEGAGRSFESLAELRNLLNRAYDSFVHAHGYLHKKTNMGAMPEDPDRPFVLALENWDNATKTAKKADAFFKQTVAPRKAVTSVETPKEALLVSLAEKGRLDFEHMAKLTGDTPEELQDALKADGLVFESPEGHFETTDAYLSGNVRKKLREAEDAAKVDPRFKENVEALKKVQPIDLEPGQIKLRFGSAWIPAEDVRDFINEVILDGMRGAKTDVRHVESEALWRVNAPVGKYTVGATQKWGTGRANAIDILEGALNLKQPTVYDKLPDGKSVINESETLAARDKLEALENEFQDWMFREHGRANRLTGLYNEKFNSNRLREYDGSHLTLPGMSAGITLRPHQKNAIWRAVTSGNTGFFHVVGAGKTYTVVGAAMEMRRLGLSKKPIVVVPNHLVGQWAQDWQRLYPQANVLAATKKDFEAAKRQEFASRIATGDWDAVIVAHKSFEYLPMSEEFNNRILNEHLDELEQLIQEMRSAEGKSGRTVKSLEKSKKRLEAKVAKRQNKEAKDQTIKFEDLGVDSLFVDEAHAYKNLMLVTKMGNVAGVPKNDSNRAFDMYMKTRYMTELNNGRGVTFATGTPISNTMAEIYTMMRYLDEKRLEEMGLSHFDAWAATFGKTVQTFEVAPEDVTRFRVSSRFSKFMNLPELVAMFRATGDVKLAEDLNLPIPKLKGDGPKIVVVPPSARVLRYVGHLGDRADHVRGYKEVKDAKTGKTHRMGLTRPDPSEDNMLKITGEGRKVALDYRAIDTEAPDEETTKLNAAVQRLAEIWEEGKKARTTQAVMLDLATPKAKKDSGMFNAYADIKNKLIGRGIPADEIAFIHDAKTDKAKLALFDKVNAGQVRIVLGSTDKMGVGTNIQKRLIALHHLDSPWRPSDIEQREGRILRQGNDNPEIQILRYVTEKSFDAYMWQGIERKAGFIRDVMKGDPGVREAEDVDGVALSYAEAKALATGNPLVAEKMKVDLDATKLERSLAAHNSQQATNKVKLASIPEQMAGHEDYIKRLQQDIATREANKSGEFRATVAKGQYTERKDAGAAINGAVERNRSADRRKIGEFRGFELYADGSGNAYLQGDATHYFQTNNENPLGTIQSMESALRGLEPKLEARKETIELLKKEKTTREAELNKPYPKKGELDKLLARKKEIDAQLAVNAADPTAEAASEKGIEEVASGEVAEEGENEEPESGAEFGAYFLPKQIQALIDKALRALTRLRGKSAVPTPKVPLGENVRVGGVPRTAPGAPTEPPPVRTKETAGNIRLDKLNTPEDVLNAIRESAKRNKQEFEEQRRGKIPFKQTRSMAEKLVEEGMFTEKDLEKMKKGTALNAEELQAARSMLIASAQKVRKAAKRVREDNSVDSVLAFQEALLRHDGIQKAVAGAVAEAGRALSQQRMVANALEGKSKTGHERVLDALGGKELSEEAARRLAEIPEDDPVALNNFLKSQKQWTTAQKIEAYWIANVLSSPRTPIKKVLGDVILGTMEAGRRFVDTPVDKIMAAIQGRKSETTLREAAVAPLAYVSAIPEGIRKATYIMLHAVDPTDPLALEMPRRYEFPGGVKNPFNVPGRALSAATKFFQVLAFQGELHAQAVRQAVREGLKGEELKNRAAELVQHPTDEMIDYAMKAGEFQTYTERPDALSRILMSMRDKIALPKGIPLIGGLHPMRFVIPFVQIPYNLTKQAFRYSPFGAARLNDFEYAKSPEATKTISRALIGTAIMGLFAYLAAKKLLTGSAPNDSAGRDEFYRSGKQPYSIKIGNRWVSYKAAGPFALTAAAVAAWHDRHEKKDTMPTTDEVFTLAGSMGKALLDETFLRGLKNVIDALNEPDRFASRWASGVLGGFVPLESALRTLKDSLDPTVRNPQTMYDRIGAGLPVVSKAVPPKLDVLGRPATKEGTSGFAALFPGGFSKDQPKSDLDAELDRLNKLGLKNVGFAGKHLVVDGYKMALTQPELDRYQKLRGVYLQSYLRQTFNAPEYKEMSDADKVQSAEDAIHQAEQDARGAIGDQILTERLKKVRSAAIPRRPPAGAVAQ